jgi:penicillin-binding protein 2
VAGVFPPGSIFKLIPASGALQEGVITPDTILIDEGTLYLPNEYFPDDKKLAQPFYCWNRTGHGRVNLLVAIAQSCDVYFYQIAGGYPPSGFQGLGVDRLGHYMEVFGLGQLSGVDLPGELAGLVPTPKWKRFNYAESWVTGDTYNMGIGQGFVLATPLQMVNAYAALGNGGTLYRPYLVQEVTDADGKVIQTHQPQVIGNLLDSVSAQNLALVRQGLEAVVSPIGTGKNLDVPGIPVAGKTGTAEFCDSYPACIDRQGRVKTSHAWFAAYAPATNPEIAVVVFVYGGGEGSLVALPIAGEILRYHFGLAPSGALTQTVMAPPGPPPPGVTFSSRLLGTDGWGQGGAAVTGYVLNQDGTPIPGAAVNVFADQEPPAENELVAQAVTGATGQFEYNAIDTQRASRWHVELADYPDTSPVAMDVEVGYRYMVEFQVSAP